MADIELVIKISEEDYKRGTVMASAIRNGITLPKGHGRLIDADYKISSDGRTIDTVCGYMAPTIIEAESESNR